MESQIYDGRGEAEAAEAFFKQDNALYSKKLFEEQVDTSLNENVAKLAFKMWQLSRGFSETDHLIPSKF